MEFNFDKWYKDTFKQYKNTLKIPGSTFTYDEYYKRLKEVGWIINEDNSVTFVNDGTISSEVAVNYISSRKYERERDNESWSIIEKSELLSEYASWISGVADAHGRSENNILEMLRSFNDSVIFSE